MRTLIILILVTLYWSCIFLGQQFEKDFYERISGMKFPKEYDILETYDNGEFYTTTSLKVDSTLLLKFISDYKFDTLTRLYPSHFLGEGVLKKDKPILSDSSTLFYTAGAKGRNSWLFIADLKKGILWAEIQYPDFAGN
ncbi:MAG TPA: hypothetical protein VK625_08975 [Flavitalea sp.]|nr:hypothetical protein [Flavitalea sp.]